MARRAEPLEPPPQPRRERVAAFRLGLSAESRAAMFLIAEGYRIVARRWKTPFGEIDIVAHVAARSFLSKSRRATAPTRLRKR